VSLIRQIQIFLSGPSLVHRAAVRNTFHTPTKQEYAMFHAQASALRSSELEDRSAPRLPQRRATLFCRRQRGAQGGGGLYWCGDSPDGREFSVAQAVSELTSKQTRNIFVTW